MYSNKLNPNDAITAFLAVEAPDMVQAASALQAAKQLLQSDTEIGDEDFRAVERALNRAENAETVSVVRETLQSVFRPAAEMSADLPRPSRY